MKKIIALLTIVPTLAFANPFDGNWSGFDVVRGPGIAPYRELLLAHVETYPISTMTLSTYGFDGSFKGSNSIPFTAIGTFNAYASGDGYSTRVWGRMLSTGTMTGRWTNYVDHTGGTIQMWRENVNQR